MKLNIIYEEGDCVAIQKPAGVLFDWALSQRPELIPVHRLDKDTSGIILFAKNEPAAEYLKKLFHDHQIQKTYIALVVGTLQKSKGAIDLPIGRSKRTPLKRIAVGKKRGNIREALTTYEVLKQLKDFTLVQAHPLTGRTHQIRSHFAAIGHPIACDLLYGGKKPVCPQGLSRHFLHASSIEFTTYGGSKIRLDADLPEDLQNVLRALS